MLGFDVARNRRKKSISENNIQEAKEKLTRARKRVTPSGVIAELSIGFWVNLLTAQYEDINTKALLWPNLTTTVFPNTVGAERDISFILNRFKSINKIRNRLSHHEPLWKSGSSTNFSSALRYVNNQYTQVMDCIGYISKDRRDFLLESYMGKEFKRISTLETINAFIGQKIVNAATVQQFKKDLNLHLNNCDKGNNAYITRGSQVFYKLVRY